jgi:hypothetical protein
MKIKVPLNLKRSSFWTPADNKPNKPNGLMHAMPWPWTNFSLRDKTWAEFSTLEVAACVLCACVAIKQNSLT